MCWTCVTVSLDNAVVFDAGGFSWGSARVAIYKHSEAKHQKNWNLSLFTHPHVVPNLYAVVFIMQIFMQNFSIFHTTMLHFYSVFKVSLCSLSLWEATTFLSKSQFPFAYLKLCHVLLWYTQEPWCQLWLIRKLVQNWLGGLLMSGILIKLT